MRTMVNDNKTQEVRAIENGTVIDHIPSDQLFKIIRIMQLDRAPQRITFGLNLESKRMGTKAIIKIADRYCQDKEINRIALFAPMAMVNTIKDFEVIEKRKVTVPERMEGFVRCVNPKCITNNEPVRTAFDVMNNDGKISLRCRYCEKVTLQSQMELIK